MNEIQVYSKTGLVHFDNYNELLTQAQQLAELVNSVEVDEESMKPVKKLLAEVNKKVDELETKRKEVKKFLLTPYEEFEQQIKSITSIVKDSERNIRSKVKELEEQEREDKKEQLRVIWNKRVNRYPSVRKYFTFEKFIKPQHLNKSVSVDKTEYEMVGWLQDRYDDMTFIEDMENADDVMFEYEVTLNIAQAVKVVEERKQRQQQLNLHLKPIYTIVFDDKFAYDMTMKFINDNKLKLKGD